jgi:hypothetical protein
MLEHPGAPTKERTNDDHYPSPRPRTELRGATPDRYVDRPTRIPEAWPKGQLRESRIERRRAWLFDGERSEAIICSSTAYLVGVGIVLRGRQVNCVGSLMVSVTVTPVVVNG